MYKLYKLKTYVDFFFICLIILYLIYVVCRVLHKMQISENKTIKHFILAGIIKKFSLTLKVK